MNKEVLLPLLKYWIFFFIIPSVVAIIFGKLEIQVISGTIGLYIVFLAPILFIPTYKKASKNAKNKFVLLLFSFIVPYLVIYSLLVCGFLMALKNLSF
jgi:hypothetical protein